MSDALIPKHPIPEVMNILRAKLVIDPEKGIVYGPSGKEIGCPDFHGHIVCSVYKGSTQIKIRRCHLIWWKHHGYWPVDTIDHDNRIRSDDRAVNLIARSQRYNMANKLRPDGQMIGVRMHSNGFETRIQSIYLNIQVGIWPTETEANQKYAEYSTRLAEYAAQLAEEMSNVV